MSKTIIITPQNKGQITIPKKWRDQWKADAYKVQFNNSQIIIMPLYADSHSIVSNESLKTGHNTLSKTGSSNKKNHSLSQLSKMGKTGKLSKKMEKYIKDELKEEKEIYLNQKTLQKKIDKLGKEESVEFSFVE